MRALATSLLALLALAPAVAHAGKKDSEPTTTRPAPTVFLRSVYDMDPTSYLGRFIKPGTPAGALDESSTFVSKCSAFVKPKVVDAGEVFYTELFSASEAARVSAGIERVASLGFEAKNTVQTRAKYTLYEKMQGVIEDPAGFDACCKQAPDLCSDRYVAEFLKGAGATYIGAERQKKFKIGIVQGAGVPGLDLSVFPEIEAEQDTVWFRGTTFHKKPVYFAFKVSEVNVQEAHKACGPWTGAVPKSSLGQYFVGVAPNADGEATGRGLAMNDAREQVVKFIGEQISMGSLRVDTVSGSGAGVSLDLQQQGSVQRAASGIASFVKDEAWCVQPVSNARGMFTAVKVLAFLPTSSMEAAAKAAAANAK